MQEIYKKIKNFTGRIEERTYGDVLIIFVSYTFLWIILALLLVFIFRVNGKSFIRVGYGDGKYQHFIAFDYLCEYLSQIIQGNGFSPFFNYTIGQGQDTLSALVGYDFTDPISGFFALLFPISRIGRFSLMIFTKLYLTGFSFITYCITVGKKEKTPIIMGAIAYTFYGGNLWYFTLHPNFISWAYYLPFILSSIELFYRKGKKLPFILAVFINAIANYYVFYMNVILSGIYVVFRFIFSKEKGLLIKKNIHLLGMGLISILLSAFCLFPIAYAYSQNARVAQPTGYTKSLWLYPANYYKKLFEYFFSPFVSAGYSTYMGINIGMIIPISLLIILLYREIRGLCTNHKESLFQDNGEHRIWFFLLILFFIMLCIPFSGKILNGFSYPTNRWSFVLIFAISFIFVELYPLIRNISHKDALFAFLITALYVILCLFNTRTNTQFLKYIPLCLIMWISLSLLIIAKYRRNCIPVITVIVIFLGAAFEIYFTYGKSKANLINSFDKAGNESFETSAIAIPEPEGDNDFFRVDTKEITNNVSRINGIRGTNSYWSMLPKSNLDYYSGLELNTNDMNCRVNGLDGRLGLLSIASVKYYTCPIGKEAAAPYGYIRIANSHEKKYSVFKNPSFLPIGFTYKKCILKNDYDALNGLGKEQALLYGAVMETIPDGFDVCHPLASYEELSYIIDNTRNVKIKNKSIVVNKKGGSISFSVNAPENQELVFCIRNAELSKKKASVDIVVKGEGESVSSEKKGKLSNSNYNWYYNNHDLLFNLGSNFSGKTTITLIFKDKCSLTSDPIEIIAVPMAKMEERIKELREHVLENIVVRDDYVSGTIDLPEKRILQFSIPYSKGWNARVDGRKQKLLRSDVMYMALPLSKGKHSIQLYYHTPYLREGVIVAFSTFSLCVVYGLFDWIKRRRMTNDLG